MERLLPKLFVWCGGGSGSGGTKVLSNYLILSLVWSIVHLNCFVTLGQSSLPVLREDHHENYQSYLMPVPTVRVLLFSFERGNLLEITNTPNSDVILTKPPAYFEAYMFECNATYPVQWVYLGEGAPVITGDVGRSFRDFFDPGSYTYHTGMVMYKLYEQNSGRYVCRGIESFTQKLSIFIHLYVPGNDILVSTMEKTVQVAPYKDQINLPCGVSDPTQADQINLYKGNSKGAYKRIETNSSITFNPRKGFRLQRQQLQDIFGKYLCVAATSKKRVRLHVVSKDVPRTKRQVLSNDIYGVSTEALQFSYDARYHRMLCCSASAIAPRLTYAGCTSIVDCELKSACFRENKCERREGEFKDNGYYNHYIGLDPQGCTGYTLRDDPNGDFGLLLCTDHSRMATQYQPFLLNRGNLFMSFDKTPPAEQVMTLSRATHEELFVGSETMFRCNASRFFFGFGLRWAFETLNGDLEFILDAEVIRDSYFVNAHRRHTILRIPHTNIKSVVCVAPVWNSPTEWRILSLAISVSRIFYPPPSEEPSDEEPNLSPVVSVPTAPADTYEVGATNDNNYRQKLILHQTLLPVSSSSVQATLSPQLQLTKYSPQQLQLTKYSPQQLQLTKYSPPQQLYLTSIPTAAEEPQIYALPRHHHNQRQEPLVHSLYGSKTGPLIDFEIIPAIRIPGKSGYSTRTSSSHQYFYSNNNNHINNNNRRSNNQLKQANSHYGDEHIYSPQSAIQFLNSTFDLSSILQ